MLRRFGATIWILVGAAACTAVNVVPTNCWVGLHGEYCLVTAAGGDPGAAAVEDAARIIHERINHIGLADFEVRTRSDGVIEIDLPPITDATEVRGLIEPTGDIEFVPVPAGETVEVGDAIPSAAVALVGRESVTSVSPGSTMTGDHAVDIALTAEAGEILNRHSSEHIGEQLAIVMDGTVLTAPLILAPLGHLFQVSAADATVVNRLVTILRLPPLPGTLEELTFGPFTPTGCVPDR